MTWDKVDWDLWAGEVIWMFIRNQEGVPEHEYLQWHWKCGFGPAQTYYKLSVKHVPQVQDGDPGAR